MFDLTKLGWSSFQQLCLSITREILGQTVEVFLDTSDGGRDGAFIGKWNPVGQEGLFGNYVIQCKFTSKQNHIITSSDLKDELTKVRRLVNKNMCNSYLLMTNAGVTGHQAAEISKLFREAGVQCFQIYGETWINLQILENKRLRMLVPRVYGIGDLSQILDERAYSQTRAILESLREDLSKVVVTEAYRKAISALNGHGFVLLLGEPAIGKTTIASMLAMAAIDNWDSSILKLDSPDKTFEHWNPDEPNQFFWIDDAFGVNQYEAELVKKWNHYFPQLNSMLRKGVRMVMTSRDYIFQRAKKDLKTNAFPPLLESQVIINVEALTLEEKRQILYNHMKLGGHPVSFRTLVKPHLEFIASHKRFIPELARRLSNPFFTKKLRVDRDHIEEFIDKREEFLKGVIQNLDSDSKAALGLIFVRGNQLDSPIELDNKEREVLSRLGSDISGCINALDALNGSLVHYSYGEGKPHWTFKHPTIGDAYSAILSENPEQIGIYLLGIEIIKFFSQCTCGDVGIENAVIIPETIFSDVLEKIETAKMKLKESTTFQIWEFDSIVQRFLSYRCSKAFLSRYIDVHPDIIATVSNPGLYLCAVSEVDLAIRLNEVGLLPEVNRKKFIECISEYAIDGEDLYGLDNDKVRSLFTDSEFQDLLVEVLNNVPSKLEDIRLDYESNLQPGELPEDAIQPFVDMLGVLKRYFEREPGIKELIKEQMERVNDWIDENTLIEPEYEKIEFNSLETMETSESSRSIFDDIDEE